MVRITTILLLALSLMSCGARKVEKSQVKESTEIVDTTKTVVQNDVQNVANVVENCDEITIEPADTSKPMVINGKTYINAILKHKKTNKHSNTKMSQKSVITVKKGVNVAHNKQIDTKHVDKKQYTPWWLWILIVLLAIAYYYRKRLFLFF